MKNKTKFIPLILMAIALSGCSHFEDISDVTSKDASTIEVASGKINVSLAFNGLHTYSALADENGDLVDDNNHKYTSTATEENGVFTNAGTANYDSTSGVLSLKRMTPGDRVTFDLTPSLGDTNVKIKLRFSIIADSNKLDLVKALTFKIQEGSGTPESYMGLASYVSDWVSIDPANVTTLDTLHFDISMPMNKGNEYQDKDTSYVFSVEAVQGNAYTTGTKDVQIIN